MISAAAFGGDYSQEKSTQGSDLSEAGMRSSDPKSLNDDDGTPWEGNPDKVRLKSTNRLDGDPAPAVKSQSNSSVD